MARISYPPIRSPFSSGNGISHVWERWFRDIAMVTETVSTRGVRTVEGGETLDLTACGFAINLVADTADATVILPYARTENIGETVTVTLTDATNNGVINCKSGDTLLGETSAKLSIYGTTFDLMVQSATKWVII